MEHLPSNPADNREVEFVASSTATFLGALAAIGLRFLCRCKSRAKFWWDDWLALAGFAVATALYMITMIKVRFYTGHHIGDVDLSGIVAFGKANFMAELGYGWCLAFVKLSLLAFYWRIFSTAARWPMIAMSVLVLAWAVTWFFFLMFQCRPVSGAWDVMATNRKCFNLKNLWVFGPLPHIIEDVILLIIPIPYILKLNLRLEQRLSLCSIFLLGFFVTIVSIMRVVFVHQVDVTSIDFTWTFTNVSIWSAVEINCACICASLPCLRPLVTFIKTGRFQNTSVIASTVDHESRRMSRGPSQAGWGASKYSRNFITATESSYPGSSGSQSPALGNRGDNNPLENIVVATDWNIVRE